MSINNLIELDNVKESWKRFNDLKDSILQNAGQMKAVFLELDSMSLFTENVSPEELAIYNDWKTIIDNINN